MRTPKEWKRRVELRKIDKRLRQVSQRPVPRLSGEDELRGRVQRFLAGHGRVGVDEEVVLAVQDVIDSHVIEMQTEISRRHSAEDMELGQLQARLDGLIAQYRHDEGSRTKNVAHLGDRLYGSLRRIEDRDTPMPAGPGAEEEPGYMHGNVGELAGWSIWTRLILYVVLLLAMVADLITFRQVVERVVNDTAVFPLVLALTVTTTYVAHRAGELFRRTKDTLRTVRRAVGGWILSGIWLGMGLGAFVFRLLAPSPVSGNAATDFVNSGSFTPSSADGSPALSAAMLLLLYVLTGAIAITAGFQRPRTEVEQYHRTSRRLRRTEPRLSALRRDVTESTALSEQLSGLRERRRAQYLLENSRCANAARRVRAEAAIIVRQIRRGDQNWLRRLTGRPAVASELRPDAEPPVGRREDEPTARHGRPWAEGEPTLRIYPQDLPAPGDRQD